MILEVEMSVIGVDEDHKYMAGVQNSWPKGVVSRWLSWVSKVDYTYTPEV